MPSEVLVACVVCFGMADGPLIDAARAGVLVMAGMTCAMLAGVGLFFVRVARRSGAASQEGSRRD